MSKFGRTIWILVLLFYFSGCSGFRPGAFPADERQIPIGQDSEQPKVVTVGAMVELTLKSGEVVKGKVAAISPEMITLGMVGEFAVPVGQYSRDEVLKVEIQDDVTVARGLLITAFAVTGVLVVLATVFVATADFSGLD